MQPRVSERRVSQYRHAYTGSTVDPKSIKVRHSNGDLQQVEVDLGPISFDVQFEDSFQDKTGETWVKVSDLAASVSLPQNLTRDEYDRYYKNPEAVIDRLNQGGLRRHQVKDNQALVWVRSRADGNLYLFRQKDLGERGSMARYNYKNKAGQWQGPQCPRFIPYTPTEVWIWGGSVQGPFSKLRYNAKGETVYQSPCMSLRRPAAWEQVGQLSEAQGIAAIGYGPRVQPGRLETVPYFENDRDDDYNQEVEPTELNYLEADYNGPMIQA